MTEASGFSPGLAPALHFLPKVTLSTSGHARNLKVTPPVWTTPFTYTQVYQDFRRTWHWGDAPEITWKIRVFSVG